MTHFFTIHPQNPQRRLLRSAAQTLAQGGIVAAPTDSCYALICQLDDKAAVDRIRRLRGIDERHHLSLLCRDLAEIATYAKVDNAAYRLLRLATPGPYTFILEATREVPRRLSHPSRKTIGIRVPDHPVMRDLLEELGQPVMGTTLQLAGDDLPLNDGDAIAQRLRGQIELALDAGNCGVQPTTIIDLTGKEPQVVREGRGDLERLGLG